MLVLDDVACDAHTKTRSLANGLGGEEILEQSLLYLVVHAFTIVGNTDGERGTRGRGR